MEPGPPSFGGMYLGLEGDTLHLLAEPDAAALAIPVAALNALYVRRGVRSRWGEGALLGIAVFGVGLGAVSAATCEEPQPCSGLGCIRIFELSKGDMFAFGFAGGAILGGVVGGLIGRGIKTDRWDQMPRDGWHVSFAPRPSGFVAGVSYAF